MKTFREIVLSDSENTAKKQIAKRNPKPFTFLFLLSHAHTTTHVLALL